jgi:hypothetical protein
MSCAKARAVTSNANAILARVVSNTVGCDGPKINPPCVYEFNYASSSICACRTALITRSVENTSKTFDPGEREAALTKWSRFRWSWKGKVRT